SLLTGLYPHQHGAIINGWFPNERPYGTIRPGVELLPAKLVQAGYRFVHVGVQQVRVEPSLQALTQGGEFIGPLSAAEHLGELQKRGLKLGVFTANRDPIIDYDRGKPTVFSSTSPRPAVFPLREDLFYDDVLTQKMVEVIQAHQAGAGETGGEDGGGAGGRP